MLLLALLGALLAAAPAAAADASCARQVIDDWYDNGRVDKEFPFHCYEDAIQSLPVDVKDYSSAAEDIQRALQARLRGQAPPPATRDPSPETPSSTETTGGTAGPSDPSDPEGSTGGSSDPGGPLNEAVDELGPDDASSVPIPLLVLAGLALLLVAAGSAGYIARRLQARRGGPAS